MKTVVLVPYRADNGHRDRIWNFLRANVWSGWDVRVGEHHDGLFNRSAAINAAADCQWDMAVIADADTWVPREQLDAALQIAQTTGGLTAAFSVVVEVSRASSAAILSGKLAMTDSMGADRVRLKDTETQSSMLVITRQLWEQCGGFDPRFVGWGGEDSAFYKTATVLAGAPHRVGGAAFHLWHAPSRQKFRGPDYQRNVELWRRYERARTETDIQCLLSEWSATKAAGSARKR